jgi:glycosyltransferase involved in cell wall biosynthesis
MKISIVIPAYNEEERIESVLRAALAQDYPDFEVVLVVSGNDRTQEIARSFPAVTVIRCDERGLPLARQRGYQAASGEIIANLDADCLPHKDWLSTGARYFLDPNVVAVSGPYDYYDGGAFLRYSTLFLERFVSVPMNIVRRRLGGPGRMVGGNTLIKRTALLKTGGYDTSITFWGEDVATGARISKAGKVIFTTKLTMPSSARRFKSEGYLRLSFKYMYFLFKKESAKDKKAL